MANVLILDHDTGFLLWLGTALMNAGHATLPAGRVSDAKILMKELDFTPEVLVVDPLVRGAQRFASTSQRSDPGVRVLLVADNPSAATRMTFDATLVRPTVGTAELQATWLDCIESLVPMYRRGGPGY